MYFGALGLGFVELGITVTVSDIYVLEVPCRALIICLKRLSDHIRHPLKGFGLWFPDEGAQLEHSAPLRQSPKTGSL